MLSNNDIIENLCLDDYLYNMYVSDDIFNVNIGIKHLYSKFGYSDKELFNIDLDFFINLYNLNLVEDNNVRLLQSIFRNSLINRDKVCILSKTHKDQCEAAHIIPVAENNNYDVNNGLLLSSNLHKLYDKFYWSINPNTLLVEINNKLINGKMLDCNNYIGYKVKIVINPNIKNNLTNHYNKFLSKI